jgi:murein DD-endopeptidase MepM/ murein hydrolase activator NlpD
VLLRILVLAASALALLPPAQAVVRVRKSRPKPKPKLRHTVTPSEAIERQVEAEMSRARDILDNMQTGNLLASPYVVSAIYYHEGFLNDYPERADADPSRRIVARISRMLTPEAKARFIELLGELHRKTAQPSGAVRFVLPVSFAVPRRFRRQHEYAIDLFAAEGSPVRSASAGLVVLAESGWTSDDPLSTSSRQGGNSVIVFDPAGPRFYRYCHLQSVAVAAGEPVEPGQAIGAVGHTGLNASRDGHGLHLHFEVNRFDGQSVQPLTNAQLRVLVGMPAPPARRRAARRRRTVS